MKELKRQEIIKGMCEHGQSDDIFDDAVNHFGKNRETIIFCKKIAEEIYEILDELPKLLERKAGSTESKGFAFHEHVVGLKKQIEPSKQSQKLTKTKKLEVIKGMYKHGESYDVFDKAVNHFGKTKKIIEFCYYIDGKLNKIVNNLLKYLEKEMEK